MYSRKLWICGHVQVEKEHINNFFGIIHIGREETHSMVKSNYKCLYWYIFKLHFGKKLFRVIFGTRILVQLNNLNNILELDDKKIWLNICQLPTIFRFLSILSPQNHTRYLSISVSKAHSTSQTHELYITGWHFPYLSLSRRKLTH